MELSNLIYKEDLYNGATGATGPTGLAGEIGATGPTAKGEKWHYIFLYGFCTL